MKKLFSLASVLLVFSIFSSSVSANAASCMFGHEYIDDVCVYLKADKTSVSLVDLQKGSVTLPVKIYISDNTKNIQSISAAWKSSSECVKTKNLKNPMFFTDSSPINTYSTSDGKSFSTQMTPFCFSYIDDKNNLATLPGSVFTVPEADAATGISADASSFIFRIDPTTSNPDKQIKNNVYLGSKSDEYMITEFEVEFAQNTPAGNYTVNLIDYTQSADGKTHAGTTYCNRFDKGVFHPSLKSVTFNVGFNLGDIDNSGTIDAGDASIALSAYSTISNGGSSPLSDIQTLAADTNYDNIINAIDASKILTYYSQISVGQTPSFN